MTAKINDFVGSFANDATANAYIAARSWTAQYGWVYWDSTASALKTWDGSAWTTGGGTAAKTHDTYATIAALTPAEGDEGYPTDAPGYSAVCFSAGTWTWFYEGTAIEIPPSAGWTAMNAAVTASAAQRVVVVQNGSDEYEGEYRACPSVPYASGVIFGFRWGGIGAFGVGFRQSSDGKLAAMVRNTENQWICAKYTNRTTWAANYFVANTESESGKFWVKVIDNNTNRIIQLSYDRINWTQVHSVGRTDHLTADQIWYGCTSGDSNIPASMGLFDYEEL